MREHVAGVFEGLDDPAGRDAPWPWAAPPPRCAAWWAPSSRTRRSSAACGCCRSRPIGEVAERFELDPERVRLLPAGILVLEAVSDQLGLPLRIARGGLREGVILELVEAAA